MFGYTKRRNSDTQGDWSGSPQLQRAFNYGEEPNIRCFVAKSILLHITCTWGGGRGGSQKVTRDDEGEGGGHDTPQKLWRHLWTAPYGISCLLVFLLLAHDMVLDGVIVLGKICTFAMPKAKRTKSSRSEGPKSGLNLNGHKLEGGPPHI